MNYRKTKEIFIWLDDTEENAGNLHTAFLVIGDT
jgi:hypothetical protein